MKKRNIFISIVSLMLSLVLTGCMNKDAIKTEELITIAENHSFSVTDETVLYEAHEHIEKSIVIGSKEGWEIEFYVLKDGIHSEDMFNTKKKEFKDIKKGTSKEVETGGKNYSIYELTNGGYYMYVCRIDKTLLNVKAEDKYKDNIKNFIDELGY